MKILVTGGTGFIGSHTVVALLEQNHEVVIVDNLSNSNAEVLKRITTLTGKTPVFYQQDVSDTQALDTVFSDHTIDAVIHFAALKAPAISAEDPILYYQNNLNATLSLAKVMAKHGVKQVVFSSSAAVYGLPETTPIKETYFALDATNPYGQTKVICERIWQDIAKANDDWNITLLRYFNPVGAHESGLIGEDPNGPPNNLLSYITQVAVGAQPFLRVFGDDYDTPDGTGIRDYIHISDVVSGHLAALGHGSASSEAAVYNLGTGKGCSVFELLTAFEAAAGVRVPYRVLPRRPGDIARCYADVSKAKKELNWQAEKSLQQICADAWRWQQQNPAGYRPA